MTIDEIKDYIKDYFIEHDCYIFEDFTADPRYLEEAAIRYQYFGESIFEMYKYDLTDCLFRNHKWFLLEMVNPEMAFGTSNIQTALTGVLDHINTELWDSAYKYYDHIGHEQFDVLKPWLDEYRDILCSSTYDIV